MGANTTKLPEEVQRDFEDHPQPELSSYHSYSYLLRRNDMGNWCGYIAIPIEKYESLSNDQREKLEDVHGGITFSSRGSLSELLNEGEKEKDETMILGFDTVHGGDLILIDLESQYSSTTRDISRLHICFE